jgi:hypothetical protein
MKEISSIRLDLAKQLHMRVPHPQARAWWYADDFTVASMCPA